MRFFVSSVLIFGAVFAVALNAKDGQGAPLNKGELADRVRGGSVQRNGPRNGDMTLQPIDQTVAEKRDTKEAPGLKDTYVQHVGHAEAFFLKANNAVVQNLDAVDKTLGLKKQQPPQQQQQQQQQAPSANPGSGPTGSETKGTEQKPQEKAESVHPDSI